MTTLADFLLARIAEDEAVARAVMARMEHAPPATIGGVGNLGIVGYPFARVLAECAAKRAIVTAWGALYNSPPPGDEYARQAGETAGHVFRALASVHADHPDYREEWR